MEITIGDNGRKLIVGRGGKPLGCTLSAITKGRGVDITLSAITKGRGVDFVLFVAL